jgi:hypothetical protein
MERLRRILVGGKKIDPYLRLSFEEGDNFFAVKLPLKTFRPARLIGTKAKMKFGITAEYFAFPIEDYENLIEALNGVYGEKILMPLRELEFSIRAQKDAPFLIPVAELFEGEFRVEKDKKGFRVIFEADRQEDFHAFAREAGLGRLFEEVINPVEEVLKAYIRGTISPLATAM